MSVPGSIAYLNGDYLPLEECKISALDRGFIFGDAIYELIPVYNDNPDKNFSEIIH